jgi:hypothetical protein
MKLTSLIHGASLLAVVYGGLTLTTLRAGSSFACCDGDYETNCQSSAMYCCFGGEPCNPDQGMDGYCVLLDEEC